MTHEAMAAMTVVHVGAEQSSHDRRDLARITQFDQQVEVIRHQTIMKESKREPVAVLGHQVKERAAIIVISENRFAIVPSILEVEASFLGPLQGAGKARHVERLRHVQKRQMVQFSTEIAILQWLT